MTDNAHDLPEQTPDDVLVVDDDGLPVAAVNVATVQDQATRLAYDMADACNDPEAMVQVTIRHMHEAGPGGFGYVTAAALRIMAEHILNPMLDVTDAINQSGAFTYNLRAGLADAARNARESLGAGQ